jgi:hypothetical protein
MHQLVRLLPARLTPPPPCRCDAAADMVQSLDLTSGAEKHAIHIFVEKCLGRLGQGDRDLPQVGGVVGRGTCLGCACCAFCL